MWKIRLVCMRFLIRKLIRIMCGLFATENKRSLLIKCKFLSPRKGVLTVHSISESIIILRSIFKRQGAERVGWKLSDLITCLSPAEVLGRVGCLERKLTNPWSHFWKQLRTEYTLLNIYFGNGETVPWGLKCQGWWKHTWKAEIISFDGDLCPECLIQRWVSFL